MALLIPFNYNPVDNKESTTSYTVPAGKYAIVSATLSVSNRGVVSENQANIMSNSAVTASADSVNVELKLKTGEVLTKLVVTGSASANTTAGTTTGNVGVSSIAAATLYVDSNMVSYVSAGASASATDSNATTGIGVTVSVTGVSVVAWHIAEYNNIE